MKHLLSLLIAVALAFSFTPYHKEEIKQVKIGTQVWTKENLAVSTFRNGDTIPEAPSNEAWMKASEEHRPAWCYYENDTANGNVYGKIYNWYAVNDPRKLAPKGWHIPSEKEWTRLIEFAGGFKTAGMKLKSPDTWYDNYGDIPKGTNETGFSALGGSGRGIHGEYNTISYNGYWWTSTIVEDFPRSVYLRHSSGDVELNNAYPAAGYYIRCVKD
jgi:uncharacterized protein (TIGR02145 family)